MQAIRCPHCGGIMGEIPEVKRLHDELSKREFTLIEAILAAGNTGITGRELAVKVFGERLGTSDEKIQHTAVLISRMRQKVERFGYFLPKIEKRGRYRIEPLEVRA